MSDPLDIVPVDTREYFEHIIQDVGLLTADVCEKVCNELSLSIESLMLKLLPIVTQYSIAPISSYHVGAIVLGCKQNPQGWANLYFGANLEFSNQALAHTVHAEQAAIANAWLQGETGVAALAVSAAPCGHCRQFLVEVVGKAGLPILIPSMSITDDSLCNSTDTFKRLDLSKLLPEAFYPSDLGSTTLMMQALETNNLILDSETDDDLINSALEAAQLSYAPYTDNYSGCAIQLSNNRVVIGRYAENVAYNPSLPAYSSAYSQLILNGFNISDATIKRIVLVEQPTKTNQKQITELLISTSAFNVELEYFTATRS